MNQPALDVLLVEHDPAEARRVREALGPASRIAFRVEWAEGLAAGMKRLGEHPYHALLLDMALPDARGVDAYLRVRRDFPDLAVVVLTALGEENLGAMALAQGAVDAFVKDGSLAEGLPRRLRYAVERQQLRTELKGMDMLDEATGLYNRRGFVALATPVLRVARRMRTPVLLVVATLEGSRGSASAGRAAGGLLRETFRDSDLAARVGPDEFAVLAVNANDGATISRRLREKLLDHNSRKGRDAVALQMDVAVWTLDPSARADMAHWLAAAKKGKPPSK
ncbi:MAG TPA: response regulator [Planctomycetota bacterium]